MRTGGFGQGDTSRHELIELVRGQHIGLVGNTGRSTAPHLHYEVFYKGVQVDPINYVLDGLTPEEYQEMVKAAEMTNQSFD